MVTKVEGERDGLKGLVEMMTRERTEIRGRRENISREGEGNMDKIAGSRLRLEEAETRGYRLTDEVKASRFELRVKREVEADIRRSLEAET